MIGQSHPEYDGVLDEIRVAIHEWMTRPSFYNTCKMVNWIIWMISQGINLVTTLLRHLETLKSKDFHLIQYLSKAHFHSSVANSSSQQVNSYANLNVRCLESPSP